MSGEVRYCKRCGAVIERRLRKSGALALYCRRACDFAVFGASGSVATSASAAMVSLAGVPHVTLRAAVLAARGADRRIDGEVPHATTRRI